MKYKGLIIVVGILTLTGCETMKNVVPPAFQSLDGFKKSLDDFSKSGKGGEVAPPELIADSYNSPKISFRTKNRQSEGGIAITIENITTSAPDITYKYRYEQRYNMALTPEYEQYHRTTIPTLDNDNSLELKMTFVSELNHTVNTKTITPSLIVNGSIVDAKMSESTRIVPGVPTQVILKGPKLNALNSNDKITLKLFDVVTQTNPDGTASAKSKFEWNAVYTEKQIKLEKPLYTVTEKVLIHYKDAINNDMGIYYRDQRLKNTKDYKNGYFIRWDPKTKRWYTYSQWKRLGRKESIDRPTATIPVKLGDLACKDWRAGIKCDA